MRRATGTGDDDFEAACARGAGVFEQQIRRAMRRDDAGLERDAETLQRVGGGLERVPIRLRAHDDADQRFHAADCSSAVVKGLGHFRPDDQLVNASRSRRNSARLAPRRVAGRLFRPGTFDQVCNSSDIDAGHFRREPLDGACTFLQQAVAPLLDAAEAQCFDTLSLASCIERGADRLGVDLAHQLADVLFLAIQPAVRGDLARKQHGVAQGLGQRQRIEFAVRQIDERFAERLQVVAAALAFALAGAFVRP